MTRQIPAAVVGLGNIGFLFDLDEKRSATWSHAKAYTRCPDTVLAAVVEPDADKCRLFAERYTGVPVFASLDALFEAARPELVSIATPTVSHHPLFLDVASRPGVRGIVCEKPFAATVAEARDMVRVSRERHLAVAVNHTRRWTASYMTLADAVRDSLIGRLVCLRAVYPGQVYNIGTHLVDVLNMVAGQDPLAVSGIEVHGGCDDPHICGRVFYKDGLSASFDVTGKRERLIVEVEALGEEGRILVKDNGRVLEAHRFSESPNYNGYLEPTPMSLDLSLDGHDPLLDMIQDIAAVLSGRHPAPRCTARDGLVAMAQVEALLASAREGGAIKYVDLTE